MLVSVPQVRLTEELATCTARVSQLQQEATSHQQRAAELQSKLTSALQDSDTHCTCISSLETQLEGLHYSYIMMCCKHNVFVLNWLERCQCECVYVGVRLKVCF